MAPSLATSPSTQRDPIGLAGGINQYGFAGSDPVNNDDPLGLKVCFEGTASQQRRQKRAFEQANRVTITSWDESTGCASAAQAVDGKDQYAIDMAEMISDPLFVARFAFGRLQGIPANEAGSGFDPSRGAYLIDTGDYGRSYGVFPAVGGCLTVPGARLTKEMVWLHESAHALGSYNSAYRRVKFTDPVMDQENAVQRRVGRPQRPGACHAR